jgi:hypothetical protein
VEVFFEDLLIPKPAAGYLNRSPLNALEQGGLVVGSSMEYQIIRDLFCDVAAVG